MSPPSEPIFKRRASRGGRRLALGALLSLLVHGALVGVFALLSVLGLLARSKDRAPGPPPAPVALLSVPASEWAQRRQVGAKPPDAATPPPAAPKKPEEKKTPLPKGQVVDVAPGNDQKPPDDAKYLADHDNKVAHETKSKDQTAFYKNAMPRRTTTTPKSEAKGHDNVSKPSVAGNQGTGHADREKHPGQEVGHLDVPRAEKRDKVALGAGPQGEIHNQDASQSTRGNSDHLRITPGPLGGANAPSASPGRVGDRNVANLMPSAATLDRIAGAAANDHLDDVDPGDGTYLNTREFKYASFFNRVKQSVGEHWDPSTPLRRRDPEGKIYAYKDRQTLLSVTLDTVGRVVHIGVSRSCGVDFLDDEAVAAFERAQPFPNPPSGLVNHGQVQFSFGFFLEVNSPSSLHIFRSRD